MEQWTRIPRGEFKELMEPRSEERFGVEVKIYTSPYDLPTDFRAYHGDEGIFHIEFKYADSESAKFLPQEGAATLEVGRDTGRLMAIRIDTRKLPRLEEGASVDEVSIAVYAPIEEVVSSFDTPSPQNKMATRKVLQNESQRLVAMLS